MDSFSGRYFKDAQVVDQAQALSISDPTQRTVFDGVTGRTFEAVVPTDNLGDLISRFGSRSVVWLGGVLNVGAMHQIHGIDEPHKPLLLKHVKAALRGGSGANINYDYVGSLRAAMMRAEQVRAGAFRRIHGFGPEDFEEMPYHEALSIGRTRESREAGILTPIWTIVRRRFDGCLTKVFESAYVPFEIKDVLPCAAVCYMARSVLNPKMVSWVGIGDRFYSTPLANAFFHATSTVAYPGREGAEFQAIPGMRNLVGEALDAFDEAAKNGPIQAASFLLIGTTCGGRPISADEIEMDFVFV